MEFREKREEVFGGLTILLVFAISSMVWCTFSSFLSQSYCTFCQNLEGTQYAGISR
jgi:hypothetical protein